MDFKLDFFRIYKNRIFLYFGLIQDLVNREYCLLIGDNVERTGVPICIDAIEKIGEIIGTRHDVDKVTFFKAGATIGEDVYTRDNRCICFGNLDGMNGSCHYCKEYNPESFNDCWKETFKNIKTKTKYCENNKEI